MAECHPVGFQWVMEAKARGARVIHVDPRFTRTSAMADTYVPIRAGSDIAFLGGIVNHILSGELDFRVYVPSSWQYQGHGDRGSDVDSHVQRETAGALRHESHGPPLPSGTERDETLRHPRCVYQILKRHYARYTPEIVEQVCGVPQALFAEVCRAWTESSGRERTTALVYSVGWTQHSVGVQYIRTGAI